jgi:hypothetical protein
LLQEWENHLQSLSVFTEEVDGLDDVLHNSIYQTETAGIIQNVSGKEESVIPKWF